MVPPIWVYILRAEENDRLSDERIYRCAGSFFEMEKEKNKGCACGGPLLLVADSLDADSFGANKNFPSGGFPKIKRNQGEKPCFDTDIGLYFSVSHSGGFWVCAMSRQEVGIDIQKKKEDYNPGIAKRFFHADEYKYLNNNGFDDFFMIWTAKESYVKYTGQGIDDNFSAFTVVKKGRINHRILEAEIKFLSFDSDYCLCLCAKNIGKIRISRN